MNGYRFFEARERRCRLLCMSAQLMCNVLFSPRRDECVVRWLAVEGLPEGTEIEGVCWDDYRQTFVFRLYHESFDLVPFGEEIPFVHPMLTAWQVKVPKEVLDNCFSNVVEGS